MMSACTKGSWRAAVAVVVLAVAGTAFAVDGIAVSVKSAGKPTGSMDARGSIWKYVISNNVSDYPGKQIYTGTDANRAKINQSGTKVAFNRLKGQWGSDICLMDINGGPVTVLTEASTVSDIGFPDDDWVYFTKDGRWNRVSTSGSGQVVAGISTPGGAYQTINRDGTRGGGHTWNRCGTNNASAYGSVNFCRDGCGAGISISGRYLTHNLGCHTQMNIWDLNSGTIAHTFKAHNFGYIAQENFNAQHFSGNSDDWVTFRQGNGYAQDVGSRQVIYRINGTNPIEVQPLQNGVFFEGSDFWVGDVGTTTPAFINLEGAPVRIDAEGGGANPAPVTVQVSNGGSGTLGQISVEENADWLTVTVNGNQLINSVDITGIDGSFTTTVIVRAAGAQNPREYQVFLTVVAVPRLSSITVRDQTVSPGESVQLTAVGYDQFGDLFSLTSVQWSAVGAGTISHSGLFTAGSSEGNATVSALSGDIAGSATMTIVRTDPVDPPARPITLISPNGGELWRVGQEARIGWICDTTLIVGITVSLSANDGDNWHVVSIEGSVAPHTPGSDTGWYSFVVRDMINGQTMLSNACRVQVSEYSIPDLNDESDNVFSIAAGNNLVVHRANRDKAPFVVRQKGAAFELQFSDIHEATVYSLSGRKIWQASGAAGQTHRVDLGLTRSTTAVLEIVTKGVYSRHLLRVVE